MGDLSSPYPMSGPQGGGQDSKPPWWRKVQGHPQPYFLSLDIHSGDCWEPWRARRKAGGGFPLAFKNWVGPSENAKDCSSLHPRPAPTWLNSDCSGATSWPAAQGRYRNREGESACGREEIHPRDQEGTGKARAVTRQCSCVIRAVEAPREGNQSCVLPSWAESSEQTEIVKLRLYLDPFPSMKF